MVSLIVIKISLKFQGILERSLREHIFRPRLEGNQVPKESTDAVWEPKRIAENLERFFLDQSLGNL